MKKITSIISLMLLAVTSLTAQHRTYYVSSDGNDGASGLSVADAWRSLDKINSTTFRPGDRILLRSGDEWKGQIVLKGSGSEGNPITLSSFGGDARPVINIGAAEGAGVLIDNESWWEVCHIEVTSFAPPEIGTGRQGIVVTASREDEEFNHFVIRDCHIHDIWGQMGGNTQYTGYNSCAILVRVVFPRERRRDPSYKPARMNDILIEDNRIERFDKCGIVSWGPRNNVVVRRNYMDNLGGDGIFVNGPWRGLIEYNEIHRSCMRSGYLDLPGDDGWWPHTAACWIQNTEETIMQFNEVYDTGREPKNGDGFAYDFDFNCKRCIAQYNYSKNNHGFMLLMYNIFGNVTRYNISENDRTHLIQMQGSLTKDRNVFYNNVFYVDYGTSDMDFYGKDRNGGIDDIGALFFNNIFYATGQGRFRTVYTDNEPMSRTFDETSRPDIPAGSMFLHNCYFGPWKNGLPDDPEAMIADPLFVAPGTGGTGLSTTGGYRLQDGSPCINTGRHIPLDGGRDFFGNPVDDGHPDLGAYEAQGTGVFADRRSEEEQDMDALDASSLAWARWTFPESVWNGSPEQTVVRLQSPLEDGISGTISWTDPSSGRTVTLPLGKSRDRQNHIIRLKADDPGILLATTLKVELQKGRFTESFELPFATTIETRRQ